MLLEELKVDRIEVGSARVSDGERDAFQRICRWASTCNHLHQIEVLGFVDDGLSVEWISSGGGKVLNLLTKGSLKHLEGQLRKTPQEHLDDILINIKKVLNLLTKGSLKHLEGQLRKTPQEHLDDILIKACSLQEIMFGS